MSQKTARPLSPFNLALVLLWLVDLAVIVAGYVILTASNASQANFYTSQSADYNTYFAAQSGSGLGATLIGAGVLGVIVTLAAHVVTRAIKRAAGPVAVTDEPDFDFDEDTDLETTDVKAGDRHDADPDTRSIDKSESATVATPPQTLTEPQSAEPTTSADAPPRVSFGDEPATDGKPAGPR